VLFSLAAHPNLTTSALARLRSIAPSTFRNHLSAAYVKLNVNNRVAAIERARQLGLLPKDLPAPPVEDPK
jgi:DNA-binding CsgD family transcriptional regulator